MYAFRFSNSIEVDGEKHDYLDEVIYGPYDSEKEAILDALRMCEDCGYEFTHLFIGETERFVPRIDAESILEDLAQLAVNDGYEDDDYLSNVESRHLRELDRLLTEAYLEWENKHPEYRNSDYSKVRVIMYSSIRYLKEEMENMRKGEKHENEEV